jgi:hypothetical protein
VSAASTNDDDVRSPDAIQLDAALVLTRRSEIAGLFT